MNELKTVFYCANINTIFYEKFKKLFFKIYWKRVALFCKSL